MVTRGLKFLIKKVEGLHYQLRGNREDDLRLCFRICNMMISHDAAQILKSHNVCYSKAPFHFALRIARYKQWRTFLIGYHKHHVIIAYDYLDS